ncbi:extracellular solute-binding protein [Roseinatronobacter alkalisoli]|uniref:Extracellular solute-binding protein n=1 Tax=Roseinatronobacter alkalisoli TaxID=3028235 RepID=A0ABT5TD47_9RHOB|nr:extracellular solute-binding protein [Roseinatronobacter sp. HJB301]MDD7973049.1 extracellular solute-binding protein [Roseinatronobacter sp. HJB301]
MRNFLASSMLTIAAGLVVVPAQAQTVEIEYWQYIFDTRVRAMDQLIERFHEEYPDIRVRQTTFPYADYQTRIVAAHTAGQGPDVVQLFYGWLDNFVAGELIQPLSEARFPAAEIEADFFPIVGAMQRDGQYWGLPTAVRSLALFINNDLFEEAGLDPANPPQTIDELRDAAISAVKYDSAGNITSVGLTLEMGAQDHHWWREGLVRQFGGVPYDDDGNVAYDSDAGLAALEFVTNMQTEDRVGTTGFMDEGQAAFRAGMAAMTIDGTFRLGSFNSISHFNWTVAELPANDDGLRSNYASYFANAIGARAEGERREAAETFLQFLTSPEAMEVWLEVVGELPARREVAQTDKNLTDPVYGPFLAALDYAHTTRFVDEAAQRQVAIDMVNRVVLQNQSPADSLAAAAAAEQAIIDRSR